MYIVLFFKRYLERVVGSECCLVAVQNIATIWVVEEAMTLITHNPHRGNLVACQVSLNWLWPGKKKKDFQEQTSLAVSENLNIYLNILMQKSGTALLEVLPS